MLNSIRGFLVNYGLGGGEGNSTFLDLELLQLNAYEIYMI